MTMKVASLLVACLWSAVSAQQVGVGANGGQAPAPQPIDAVIMQVFDKDHGGSVSLQEATTTLDAFGAMGGMGAEPGQGPNEIQTLIEAAKKVVPILFEIVDADNSKGLDAKELKVVAKLDKALKSGAMRNLTRDVFDLVDADKDNALSAAELSDAVDTEKPTLDAICEVVHSEFPIRKSAEELKKLLLKGGSELGKEVKQVVAWIDADGNGQLERKEVGKAYAKFKQYFVKGASTLQTMGPMLALFGGGGGGMGGGPGGGGGGMDLGGLMGAMGGMQGGRGGMGGMGGGRGGGRGGRRP